MVYCFLLVTNSVEYTLGAESCTLNLSYMNYFAMENLYGDKLSFLTPENPKILFAQLLSTSARTNALHGILKNKSEYNAVILDLTGW